MKIRITLHHYLAVRLGSLGKEVEVLCPNLNDVALAHGSRASSADDILVALRVSRQGPNPWSFAKFEKDMNREEIIVTQADKRAAQTERQKELMAQAIAEARNRYPTIMKMKGSKVLRLQARAVWENFKIGEGRLVVRNDKRPRLVTRREFLHDGY
jgi:hypothetical protein